MPIKTTLLLWIWVTSPSVTTHKQVAWDLEVGKKITLPTLNLGTASEQAPLCARAQTQRNGAKDYTVTIELGSVAEKSIEHLNPHATAQTTCIMRSTATVHCQNDKCTAPPAMSFSKAPSPGPGWVIKNPADPVQVSLKSITLKESAQQTTQTE